MNALSKRFTFGWYPRPERHNLNKLKAKCLVTNNAYAIRGGCVGSSLDKLYFSGQSERLVSTCARLILEILTVRNLIVRSRVPHVRLYSNRPIARKFSSSGTLIVDSQYRNKPTVGFGIATIVLAVDNATLSEDLDSCNMNVPNGTTTTTTTTTTTETTIPDATTAEPTEEPPPDLTDYRLPTNIIPTAYDLELVPDLETGEFEGRVNISCNVLEPTGIIKIHSNGLQIRSLMVKDTLSTFQIDTTHELIVIRTETDLPVGATYVYIYYTGDMKNRIVGLYTSKYTEDGETRTMATSKFEPTYARQAYPCFDEPNMKAKFTVHLLKPLDTTYIALSNMPVADTTPSEAGVMVHFEESVPMSTYLSCFIVSDFQYTEKNLSDGKPFRVYATPGQTEKTHHALDVGTNVLEYFTGYFGIPFPLPKIDMAAIPDFVSGAMEHWGLVTFRETNLLYDPSISSTASKQSIATVVAHELAHSWFGNLVTMDWWNDLWLNEGFASYIEYKGVDNYDPSWQMLDQFLISELHPVLILDATLGSHPIVQTVTTPDEITEIFDTISYNKGASVLRMLEGAVGETVFKEGVTAYLNAHMYGNAITQDLLDELQRIYVGSLDISEFMNTWTLQTGYPIVSVRSEGNSFVLTQKRYLTDEDGEDPKPGVEPYNNRWTIPITYTTSLSQEPQLLWFNYTDNELRIPKPSGTWVKFNHKQIGYYRVNYDLDHWNTLVQNVGAMSVSDKTHLLEESFRIAESGQLPYDVPLTLSSFLTEEPTSYVPWNVASTMFGKLKDYLSSSEYSAQFRQFVIGLLTNAYQTLTWTERPLDTHIEKRARVTVLDLACSMGYEECLTDVQNIFNGWITSENIVLSQDLRALVYNYGMATASRSTWDLVWNKFVAETDAAEKLKLLRGLSSVNDPSLLSRLIERAKDETHIRSQDYFTLLQYVASNPIGRPIVWDYVRQNWLALVDRFTLNDRYLGSLIPSITGGFTTTLKVEEMLAFFEKHPNAGAGAAARIRALETVGNNVKWLNRHREAVETWIQNNVESTKA